MVLDVVSSASLWLGALFDGTLILNSGGEDACPAHIVSVRPRPLLEGLIDDCVNDVLFILYCPINIHFHRLLCNIEAAPTRLGGNVQLMWFPENPSEPHSCGDESCIINSIPIHPPFSRSDTSNTASDLDRYSGHDKALLDLLGEMPASVSREPVAHTTRPLLGCRWTGVFSAPTSPVPGGPFDLNVAEMPSSTSNHVISHGPAAQHRTGIGKSEAVELPAEIAKSRGVGPIKPVKDPTDRGRHSLDEGILSNDSDGGAGMHRDLDAQLREL